MRVSSKKVLDGGGEGGKIGKPTILVIDLLDASGSMDSKGSWKDTETKYQVAEKGINMGIESLKKDTTANYKYSAVEFDTYRSELRYTETIPLTPIENVSIFRGRGPNGGTPLYQSIAKLIHSILAIKKVEDRVLINIYTDGGENVSTDGYQKYSGGDKKIHDLMEDVKKNHKFTVTFVGTEFDVENMVNNAGFMRGNTMSYDGSAAGMGATMKISSTSRSLFAQEVATRGISSTDDFYTKTVVDQAVGEFDSNIIKPKKSKKDGIASNTK